MKKWIKTSALFSAVLITGTSFAGVTASAAGYKTIRWTETADLGTMDPSLATDVVSFDALQAAGEGLYRNDKAGKPKLALAKSVKKSADGLTYTFTLRSGLKWADGTALTAQDFVYGWQRSNDPKTGAQYAYLFSGIKNADAIQEGKDKDLSSLGVKALNDTTLEVTLEHAMPQLEAVLTMATFYPQSKAFNDKAGKNLGTAAKYSLSNGPFILKGWNGSNNKYSLVKNPKYWDAKAVKSKKITIQTIKDQNTGYNLYKGKKVDYTTLSADQVKKSKNNKAYKVYAQSSTFYLQFNQEKKPGFANVKIRQAFSYAIDRKTFANNILTGTATPAYTFTPTNLATDPNTGKDFATSVKVKGAIAYNVKKAKADWKAGLKQLSAADAKGVKNIELLTDDTDAAKKSAQFLQAQLQKNLKGLKVTIKTVPFKQRLSLAESKKFDVVIYAWGADYADPSTFLDLMTSDSTFNNGGWSNADYDAAMKKALTTDAADADARYADYKIAEQALEKEVGVAPLYYKSTPTFTNPAVKGVISATVGSPFDWKYAYKK
ncbi:MAG: peptide ABC transporter substrate-binding protein [Lactobacillaceae bacterium]|jgi:oligopeptide transport system substrate-binding protein|nr:peptide ABC transporter substrate-binding protein [Lactobacillaceae bacterium]